MSDAEHASQQLMDRVAQLGPALLRALAALEQVARHLHPPEIGNLRANVAPYRAELQVAHAEFRALPVPEGLGDFARQLGRAAEQAETALELFCEDASDSDGIARVLGSMRTACAAQASLYPLRHVLPPVARYFVEPAFWDRLPELDPETTANTQVGIHRANNDAEQRGGFHLYIPESCEPDEARPLIVALHGGSGHGADFLWTWLREAKSRRCVLLSPTARGSTWSLMGPDLDASALTSMVEFVAERFAIDAARVLLTGLSDGATYTLLCGLREGSPFSALAPVSGVLHPGNAANGNLDRVRDKRIFLAHGVLDWMFPVDLARSAAEQLRDAGADLVYREVADLSHTYPRELNGEILEWLDPGLAA
jgi:phospholipase/carboxylesterase